MEEAADLRLCRDNSQAWMIQIIHFQDVIDMASLSVHGKGHEKGQFIDGIVPAERFPNTTSC